ncbi:DoxX family protein [Streptomyces halobius]|uniref:DoxX family protein n=1 Tax=Streptomyces halobius TaxID=2879846 RepID=A0ABY4MEB7_9ACTN|nr:DoxX family protein [Streptomyces halobius]UQA95752.1 DoxX family protein [Streptomyces halobius]
MMSPLDTSARHESSLHGFDVGLLVLRLAVGLTMAVHGTQKLFGWFGGPGLDASGKFFEMSGYSPGRTMVAIASLSELLGGLGLVLGLLTPLAGAAIFGTMINALAVKWDGGFFAPEGVEYEMVLATAAAALALTGPGRYAIDHFLPVLRAHRLVYGVIALVIGAVAAAVLLLIRN